MNRLTAKTQYYLGAGIILLVCCTGASWYQYWNLQNQALANVYRKADIFLSTASSIRMYVKDTLRPRIGKDLTSDRFILEAMSTSFVSRQIMNHLKQGYPDFSYKRAAYHPRNPVNSADEFETKMLSWFAENRTAERWEGLIKKGQQTYYARMTPIWAEGECLQCHGVSTHAPRELLDRYGSENGFGFAVGDIVGADTIYIPMDKTNLDIKKASAWVFLLGFISLFSLFALFALLFNRTVIQQLKRLLLNLQRIYTNEVWQEGAEPPAADEFFQLRQTFQNVTATLKTVHEELRASERKYRTLFEASPYTIFVCGEQGRLTDLNQAGMSLFEIPEGGNRVEDLNFTDLFLDRDEGAKFFRSVERDGFVSTAEHTLVSRSGAQMICMIAANRLINENHQFTGIEGVITDVTEDKKLSKHLAQTERMASIGQLAAGVAHEINNPLGVILCYSDLITRNRESTEQIREDSQIIQKHANSCKKIVESLLYFSRASNTQMREADIHQCLQEVLMVLQNQMKKQSISVATSLDSAIENVVFDEDKIKQVFMNLILNGVQAMPEGGILSLATRMKKETGMIEIEVTDTGVGIANDHLDKIFEPFFTTKDRGQGTGLGLSVSYGIIKQHNGQITVSSQPASGTTFSITLPLDGGSLKQTADGPEP